MPSAFSRRAAEITIPAFETLLRAMVKDASHAPAHLREVLEKAQDAVEGAKQVYIEKVLPEEG